MKAQASFLPEVKEQYERYPYPPRNPEDEPKFLHATITECLDALNHYGFGGRRNFHENFRALCAGGGTGDSLIFLAEQLRGTNAEIVYLDMSQTSMDIAKARAKMRGLENIRWVRASLLDLAKQDIGMFDYINCSGVLHHLKHPEAGLAALESALAPGGVMGLMLYGKYGRTAIYQMQELIRLINGNGSPDEKFSTCKTLLSGLPPTNWFHHSAQWFNDLKDGDAALYDLLLHSQDRAYSIPELYDFLSSADLKLAGFAGPNPCDPAYHIRDEKLLGHVQALDAKTRYAIGELLAGNVKKHEFYATREVVTPPSPDDLDMVPVLPVNTHPDRYEQLHHLIKNQPGNVRFSTQACTVSLPPHPGLDAVARFMDGTNSLREIYKRAIGQTNTPRSQLREAFALLYEKLAPVHMLFLRHQEVPPYITSHEIQQRLNA